MGKRPRAVASPKAWEFLVRQKANAVGCLSIEPARPKTQRCKPAQGVVTLRPFFDNSKVAVERPPPSTTDAPDAPDESDKSDKCFRPEKIGAVVVQLVRRGLRY